MFRKHWRDTRGVVTILAALFLPVIVILLAAVVDIGLTAARREKLQATTDFAAQAGGSMVSDIVVEKAEAHNPPPDATDPLPYLTDDDRIAVANDSRIRDAVQRFIDQNRVGQPGTPIVTMVYPDNTVNCAGTRDQKSIDLRLTMEETFPTLFPNVFLGQTQRTIRTVTTQSIPICP